MFILNELYKWNSQEENQLINTKSCTVLVRDLKDLKNTPKQFSPEILRTKITPRFTESYFEKLSMTIWQVVTEMQDTLKKNGMQTRSVSKTQKSSIESDDNSVGFIDILKARET